MKFFTRLKKEKGAVALISIFAAMLFITFVAMIIDGGLLYYKAAKLQNAVDASVIATSHHIGSSEEYLNMYAEKYLKENGFDKEKYNDNMAINIDRIAKLSNNADELTEGYIKLNVVINDNSLFGAFSGLDFLELNKTGYAKCKIQLDDDISMNYSIIADNLKPAASYAESAVQLSSKKNVIDINSAISSSNGVKSIVNPVFPLINSVQSELKGINIEGDVHSNSDINVDTPYLDLTFGEGSKLIATNKIYFSNSAASSNASVNNKLVASSDDDNTKVVINTGSSSSGDNIVDVFFNVLNTITKSPSTILSNNQCKTAIKDAINNYKDSNGNPLDENVKKELNDILDKNTNIRSKIDKNHIWTINGFKVESNDISITNYAVYQYLNNITPTTAGSSVNSSEASIGGTEKIREEILNNTVIAKVSYTETRNIVNYNSLIELTPQLRLSLGKTLFSLRPIMELPNKTFTIQDGVNSAVKSLVGDMSKDNSDAGVLLDNEASKYQTALNDRLISKDVKKKNYANSQTFLIKTINNKINNTETRAKYYNSLYTLLDATGFIKNFATSSYGKNAVNNYYDTQIKNTYLEDDSKSSVENNKYIENKKSIFEKMVGSYYEMRDKIEKIKFSKDEGEESDTEKEDDVFLKGGSKPKDIYDKAFNDYKSSDYLTDFRYFNPQSVDLSDPSKYANMVQPDNNDYSDFEISLGKGNTKRNYSAKKILDKEYKFVEGENRYKVNDYAGNIIGDLDYYYQKFSTYNWGNFYYNGDEGYHKAGSATYWAFNYCDYSGSWHGNKDFRRPDSYKQIRCYDYLYTREHGLVSFPLTNNLNFIRSYTMIDTGKSGHNITIGQGCAVVADGLYELSNKSNYHKAGSTLGHTNNSVYTPEGIQFSHLQGEQSDNNNLDEGYFVVNGDVEAGRIISLKMNNKGSTGIVIINGDLNLTGYTDNSASSEQSRYIYNDTDCSLKIIVTGNINLYTKAKDGNTNNLYVQNNTTIVAGGINFIGSNENKIAGNVNVQHGGKLYVKNLGSEYGRVNLNIQAPKDGQKAYFSCMSDGTCYLSNDTITFTDKMALNNLNAPNTTVINQTLIFVTGSMNVKNLKNVNGQMTSFNNNSSYSGSITVQNNFDNSGLVRFDGNSIKVMGNYNQTSLGNNGLKAKSLTVNGSISSTGGKIVVDISDTSKGVESIVGIKANEMFLYGSAIVYAYNSTNTKPPYVKVRIDNTLRMENSSKLYVDNTLDIGKEAYIHKGTNRDTSAQIHVTNYLYVPYLNNSNTDYSWKPSLFKIDNDGNVSYYSYSDCPWLNYKNILSSDRIVIGLNQKCKINKNNRNFINDNISFVNYGYSCFEEDSETKQINIKYLENRATLFSYIPIEIFGNEDVKISNSLTLSKVSFYNSGRSFIASDIKTVSTIYIYGSTSVITSFYLYGDVTITGYNSNDVITVNGPTSLTYIKGRIINSNVLYSHKISLIDEANGVFSVYGEYKDGILKKTKSFENISEFNNDAFNSMKCYLKSNDDEYLELNSLKNAGQMYIYGSLRVKNITNLIPASSGSGSSKLIAKNNLVFDNNLTIGYNSADNYLVRSHKNLEVKGRLDVYGNCEVYAIEKMIIHKDSQNILPIGIYDKGLVYFGAQSTVPETLAISTRYSGTYGREYRGKLYLSSNDNVKTAIRIGNNASEVATMLDNAIIACDGDISDFSNSRVVIDENSLIHVNGNTNIKSNHNIVNKKGGLYLLENVNFENINSQNALEFNNGCTNFFGPINDSDFDGYGQLDRTANGFVADGMNYFYKDSVIVNSYNASAEHVGERSTAIQITGGETFVSCDVYVTVASLGVKVKKDATLHCTNLNTLSALQNNGNLIIREKLKFTNENDNFYNGCSEQGNSVADCQNYYQLRNGFDANSTPNKDAILYIGSSDSNYELKVDGSILNNANMYVNGGVYSNGKSGNLSLVTGENSKSHFSNGANLYAGIQTGSNSSTSFETDCNYATTLLNGGSFVVKDELTYNNYGNNVYNYNNDSIVNGYGEIRSAVLYVGNGGITLSNSGSGTIQNYGSMYVNGDVSTNASINTTKNSVGMHAMNNSSTYIMGNCEITNSGFVTSYGSYFMCNGDLTSGACGRINANEDLNSTTDSESNAYVYVGGNMNISKNNNDGLIIEGNKTQNEFIVYSNSDISVGSKETGNLVVNSQFVAKDNVGISVNGYANMTYGYESGVNNDLFTKSHFDISNGSIKTDDNAMFIIGDSLMAKNNIELGNNYSFKDTFDGDKTSTANGSTFYVKDSLISRSGSIIEGGFTNIIVGNAVESGDSLDVADNATLMVVGNECFEINDVPSVFEDSFATNYLTNEFLESNNLTVDNIDTNRLVYCFGGINLQFNSLVYSNNVYSNGNNNIKQGSVVYADNDVSFTARTNIDSLSIQGKKCTKYVCSNKKATKHKYGYTMYGTESDESNRGCNRCNSMVVPHTSTICPVTIYAGNSVSIVGNENIKNANIIAKNSDVIMSTNHFVVDDEDKESDDKMRNYTGTISSFEGNVIYNASNSRISSLFYAPKGSITFDGYNHEIWGNCFAKNVYIQSYGMKFHRNKTESNSYEKVPTSGDVFLISNKEFTQAKENFIN